jgi:hypothetical protein
VTGKEKGLREGPFFIDRCRSCEHYAKAGMRISRSSEIFSGNPSFYTESLAVPINLGIEEVRPG